MPAKRIAIVTGANRGIGRVIAQRLMKEVDFVAAGVRDAAKCEGLTADLRRDGNDENVAAYQLDVNDTHSVRFFVDHLVKQHGAPTILVNNAGVFPESSRALVEDTPTSLWRQTFETNVFGVVRMCREVVPHMKKLRYGRIVNLSSGMGQMSQMTSGSPAYRVSKAAVNALTITLASELSGTGILVNSMSPGWVRTDMGGPDAPRSPEEAADTAVWLSLLPSSGPTGQFFRDRKPIPW
jgi:NAD(P)-dependent dehydrogenase (short-subunit alcohol dehydrogenase family)